jgi:hypothetical protein
VLTARDQVVVPERYEVAERAVEAEIEEGRAR